MSKKFAALLSLSIMQPTQAHKPIILWDVHDVLICRSGVATTFWRYKDWWNVLKNSSFGLIKDLTIQTMKYLISGSSSEQFIQKARAHHNPYMEQLIIQVVNAQEPIPGMKEITDELYEAGYAQHVASNIGETPFHALTDPQQFPHLAPMFEHINIEKSLVVSEEDNHFIKKPDPQFFKTYLQKNSLDPRTQPIIFIDDNAKNVATALKMGMDGILFRDAQHLRGELEKRHILLPFVHQSPHAQKSLHP